MNAGKWAKPNPQITEEPNNLDLEHHTQPDANVFMTKTKQHNKPQEGTKAGTKKTRDQHL